MFLTKHLTWQKDAKSALKKIPSHQEIKILTSFHTAFGTSTTCLILYISYHLMIFRPWDAAAARSGHRIQLVLLKGYRHQSLITCCFEIGRTSLKKLCFFSTRHGTTWSICKHFYALLYCNYRYMCIHSCPRTSHATTIPPGGKQNVLSGHDRFAWLLPTTIKHGPSLFCCWGAASANHWFDS